MLVIPYSVHIIRLRLDARHVGNRNSYRRACTIKMQATDLTDVHIAQLEL